MNTSIYRAILPGLFATFIFVASPAMASGPSDADITAAVKAELLTNRKVARPTDIHVVTNNGVVRLTGLPGGLGQMERVEKIVAEIPGVKGVQNEMLPMF